MSVTIAQARDAEATDRILRGLPDWFGIEEAIDQYVRDTDDERLDSIIAYDRQVPVGIGLVRWPQPRSAEVHLLAVEAGNRRSGIGALLIQAVSDYARRHGAELLSVHGRTIVRERAIRTDSTLL